MNGLRVQAMSAGEEAGHARIMPLELLAPRQRECILVAEEAVAEELVDLVDAVELYGLHLLELTHRLLRDMELERAIPPPIKPLVLADGENVVLLREREARVDADALEATQLLGVERPHRRADDERRHLFSHKRLQHRQRLRRIDRDVGRDHFDAIRRARAQELPTKDVNRAACAGRSKAVEIKEFFQGG